METITFKAPSGTKRKLTRLARQQGETLSVIVLQGLEMKLRDGRFGALLGAGKHLLSGPSTYDPEAPAISPKDWEITQ